MGEINKKGQINRKLDILLDAVEKTHPFEKKNFVSMRKQVFLWLIGKETDSNRVEERLLVERKNIIGEERAVCVIKSEPDNITGEEAYTRMAEEIDRAARDVLSIDFFNIIICPVFLKNCFENEEQVKAFSETCAWIYQEMRKRGRNTIWSPFILLEYNAVSASKSMMGYTKDIMKSIMAKGLENQIHCCCPCCVITDKNEKGQTLSIDQMVKTIMMFTAFRNTECNDEEIILETINPLTDTETEFFFTARAISICEPVKSLVLNRILAVHMLFTAGAYQQDNVFRGWKHSFFSEGVWMEQLDNVVHDERYNVLTAPVYSIIPEKDVEKLKKRLEQFGDNYYISRLGKDKNVLLDKWWRSFWNEYFLSQHGSLATLKRLEENRDVILSKVPGISVIPFEGRQFISDYRKEYEYYLAQQITNYPKQLLTFAFMPEGEYMTKFRKRWENLDDLLEEFTKLLKMKIQRLSQSELVFNTGGGHIADPLEEAQEWFCENIKENPRKVQEFHAKYEKILLDYFVEDSMNKEDMLEQILSVYYNIVNGTIDKRIVYMKKKLEKLAGTDMEQLIQRVGESWLYPIHLISKPLTESAQKMYAMGNSSNLFFNQILKQKDYRIASKNIQQGDTMDRLEIVRVSERFDIDNVFTKE